MVRETRRQRFWRSLQGLLAGLSIALAGIVLSLTSIELGSLQIPQSQFFGVMIAAAGLLHAGSKALGVRKSRLIDSVDGR